MTKRTEYFVIMHPTYLYFAGYKKGKPFFSTINKAYKYSKAIQAERKAKRLCLDSFAIESYKTTSKANFQY